MTEQTYTPDPNAEPSLDLRIFGPAILVVLVVALALIFFPEQSAKHAQSSMAFVTNKMGWLYLILGVAGFIFAVWLAFGPFGHVKLGAPGEPPEYSTTHWVAMMFTAGIGSGLVAWGFAEAIYYLEDTPFGIAPHTTKAMHWAHMYPMFHWGIVPWAVYAITAVPIAYMLYVKRATFLRISSACDGALPERNREAIKIVIDIIIILGIIGGTATALGIGVPIVSAFAAELLGVGDTIGIKLLILIIWTCLFGASTYRGLKKGIKILADINMVLAGVAILFILLAGPTLFILSLTVNSFSLMINNFFAMSLWMDPIDQSGFPERWTLFYWAWWIAFAAFVGLFIGRISRGRTIRQLIVGVLIWGSLGTWAFLAIAGGYSIHLEANDVLPVSEILAKDGMSVMVAKIIASLPLGKISLLVFTVLTIIFLATTLDSAAYILASVCSKDLQNHQEPQRFSRVIWAAMLALLTAGLIVSSGLQTAQSATIVSSLPLIPVVLLMCMSTLRWLREDFGELLQTKEHAKALGQLEPND